MPTPQPETWTLQTTAAEIVRRHPSLLAYFDAIGVDDCCLGLDLRTIASHRGLDPDELIAGLQAALERGGDSA